MNKEERKKDDNYWKGYIEKQKEAVEICKICKYRKRYKELEQKEAILDKVTDILKEGTNQKIPLAEDKDWVICRKQYAREILNIIEGVEKQ